MNKKVAAIPKGYRTATPCLIVDGVELALDFYGRAFDAVLLTRSYDSTQTTTVHATMKIGNSVISFIQEDPQLGWLAPASVSNNGSQIHLYVENVDEVWVQAMSAGATELTPPVNAYWGDRIGTLIDPFNHRWSLASRVERVSRDELQRRAASLYRSPMEVEESQVLAV